MFPFFNGKSENRRIGESETRKLAQENPSGFCARKADLGRAHTATLFHCSPPEFCTLINFAWPESRNILCAPSSGSADRLAALICQQIKLFGRARSSRKGAGGRERACGRSWCGFGECLVVVVAVVLLCCCYVFCLRTPFACRVINCAHKSSLGYRAARPPY